LGFGGWGSRLARLNGTATFSKLQLALGLFPLSLGIGGQAVDFLARKRTDQVLRCNNSGSLAIFAAIRRASSLLSNFAADRQAK
jgi:hypothetical protein